eukprot:8055154-Prorocentrum_lima.AAC.1
MLTVRAWLGQKALRGTPLARRFPANVTRQQECLGIELGLEQGTAGIAEGNLNSIAKTKTHRMA